MKRERSDIVVVGAGAAGLAAAIFSARELPRATVTVVDGARSLGAKILVSGGGRCNVTNRQVTAADFNGGSRSVIDRVLAALPVGETIQFFAGLGVSLHEESAGKLFPDSNRARSVLDALLGECRRRGIRIRTETRVESVDQGNKGFLLRSGPGVLEARHVVLATGGLSLPKSGSDGAGYALARRLGHSLVETTPALVPLVLAAGPHAELSGVSQAVELMLSVGGRRRARVGGPLLWTHFGISGPAALDLSRHWLRAMLEEERVGVDANFLPGSDLQATDRRLVDLGRERPRLQVPNGLSLLMPASVGRVLSRLAGLEEGKTLGRLTREERRRLAQFLTSFQLEVKESRGYRYAEVTAGGIALDEIDPGSMESRVCPGLFLAGEILDVDGRLGGFNFQWAWASARAAARGLAVRLGG